MALAVMAGAIGLLLLGIYWPWLANALGFAPLGGAQLGMAAGLGSLSLGAVLGLRHVLSTAFD
jgi:hypothetical protein